MWKCEYLVDISFNPPHHRSICFQTTWGLEDHERNFDIIDKPIVTSSNTSLVLQSLLADGFRQLTIAHIKAIPVLSVDGLTEPQAYQDCRRRPRTTLGKLINTLIALHYFIEAHSYLLL